tara:strand:+ start:1014 stop:1235 length:222 start_codon:yes stop_codon:yes gene_type:complete
MFEWLFGPSEVTLNGDTFKKSDGYDIKVQTLPGEGYRGEFPNNKYVYDIPHKVVTVRDSNGRIVRRTEERLER